MNEEATRGHPRPQLTRPNWQSLDGQWEFAFDLLGGDRDPQEVVFDRRIEVPFAPETAKSGIGETGYTQAVWYRRHYTPPVLEPHEHLALHFAAVDYEATVWINGVLAGSHEGGYTPFAIDLTPHYRAGETMEIVVRAADDPLDLAKPRGKQDWQPHSHSIWYPRTTGIWQTVWVERLPRSWVSKIKWGSNLERWEIQFKASVTGHFEEGMSLRLRLKFGTTVLVDDVYVLSHPELDRRIALSDPGIDDSRNSLLWSPKTPTLLDAQVELSDRTGKVVDAVDSYTAIRTISTQADQILLNGRPIVLRMVLDQGYWPESGTTAPNDEAYRADVELVKAMGFNGVRKHQKIESPRFLYWADRLGLLVWEEMPSAYRFTEDSVRRLTREWMEVMDRDSSHPSVITWVPFNESWGVPNLPANLHERHFVMALYYLTKTLDPSRPVVGNDGWESVATDIVGIHDYDPDPHSIAARYHTDTVRPTLYRRQRYGGRLMVLGEHDREHPIVLSEFGGLALADPDLSLWGYSVSNDLGDYERKLGEMLRTVTQSSLFAGYCYTQFTDTYQEVNGLLYADRTPKIPIARIRDMIDGKLP